MLLFLTHVYTWIKLSVQLLAFYAWYGRTTRFYNRSLQLLRNENILFTKIFQSLANSSHQIDPDLRAELQHYSANSSYTESEINYEALDEIEVQYNVQIDRRVINSGMIALVFRGYDLSGSDIIVKLKRRNITAQLREGCESITTIFNYFAYWFPKNIYIRILRPFIRNINDIIDQCDFDKEIANLRTAKEDLAPLNFIQIPTVYNRPSEETEYILMEYIHGTHTLSPDTPEETRLHYLEQYCICACFAFLVNAIQHTDLHSGNIIFTDTGIGLIDFGMAHQMNDTEHDMVLHIAELIRDQKPVHEIDFIETFKHVFVPPLDKAKIRDVQAVEDMCIAITQPMLDNIDIDELNVTDNLMGISEHLGETVELNQTIYKVVLAFSMMGGKALIMGHGYSNNERVQQIERRSLEKAYAILMSD